LYGVIDTKGCLLILTEKKGNRSGHVAAGGEKGKGKEKVVSMELCFCPVDPRRGWGNSPMVRQVFCATVSAKMTKGCILKVQDQKAVVAANRNHALNQLNQQGCRRTDKRSVARAPSPPSVELHSESKKKSWVLKRRKGNCRRTAWLISVDPREGRRKKRQNHRTGRK